VWSRIKKRCSNWWPIQSGDWRKQSDRLGKGGGGHGEVSYRQASENTSETCVGHLIHYGERWTSKSKTTGKGGISSKKTPEKRGSRHYNLVNGTNQIAPEDQPDVCEKKGGGPKLEKAQVKNKWRGTGPASGGGKKQMGVRGHSKKLNDKARKAHEKAFVWG